jgi:hypothetical protein
MHCTFEITRTSRKVLLQFLEKHTLEELNIIPHGFSNNLIWNIGHIIVAQQMLVYNLSGLPMMVSNEMIEKYKKGTRPEHNADQNEIEEMKHLLFATIDHSEVDFDNKIFKKYQEFTTMSGFAIKSAEDAMAFNYYHEGVHTGMMMQIRKFI